MIPSSLTLTKVQDSIRDLQQQLDALTTRNVDMNGRRTINAGPSVQPFDYVTRFELEQATDAMQQASQIVGQATPVAGPLNIVNSVRIGSFSTRGSPIAHDRELFIASDLDYMAWVSTASVWLYAYGERSIAQSGIAAFTANLGANDAGARINVTDFAHMLRWTGAALEFAPGDEGSGYISFFPITPPGSSWGLCDGTTYSYLIADGTTANFVTPNYTTAAYVKVGISATIGPTAASGTTANESAHTHSIDPPSTTSGAPSATTTVDNDLALSTVAVGSATHTHATDIAPFTSAAGSAHSHGPGTLELRQTLLTGYFRR